MLDWAGWLFMLFSFGIVLMWKHVRSDTKLVVAIWFCMVLHHAVAFLNAYVGTAIGADQDALSFHAAGVAAEAMPELELSFFGDGLVPYIHFLGFFYRTFGASIFLGGELSVIAFTLSCVVLVKLVDLLDLGRFRIGIILLFGLLPSAVIFRSVTLRESWQALFFLLFVYWAVRLWKRPSILIISFMLMSAFCMAILHNGLKVYSIYMILIGSYWGIFGRKKGVRWSRHIRFLFVGLLIVCVIILTQKMEWFMGPIGGAGFGQALGFIEEFRIGASTIHGRSTYYIMLDASSVLGVVKTMPLVIVYYMFAPFPWDVENYKDFIVMLEAMLRFMLLFSAVYSWRRFSGEVRSWYRFLLIVFFGMELMWALGTVNWGTSTRHHVPGFSILVLLGAPGLILFMRRLHFGMFGRRKYNTMLSK